MRHSVTATNLHQGEPQNAKAKPQRLAVQLPDGVATYHASNPDIALAACRESERQTSSRAEAGRIVCYPPQTARPLPAPRKTPLDSSHYFLGLLFLVLSGLASGFACYLIVRYKHLHAHLTDDSVSGPQKFHAVPTPRIGGLAILIGLLRQGRFRRGAGNSGRGDGGVHALSGRRPEGGLTGTQLWTPPTGNKTRSVRCSIHVPRITSHVPRSCQHHTATWGGRISALFQALVERGEVRRLAAGSKMQRIGEIHSGLKEIQRLRHRGAVLNCHLRQANRIFQRIQDDRPTQLVAEPQYPFSFKQHGLAHVNLLALEQRGRTLGLSIVITRNQADKDARINRDHGWP